jgi:hypothetical protein
MVGRPAAKQDGGVPKLLKNFANFRAWREAQSSIRIQEGPPTQASRRIFRSAAIAARTECVFLRNQIKRLAERDGKVTGLPGRFVGKIQKASFLAWVAVRRTAPLFLCIGPIASRAKISGAFRIFRDLQRDPPIVRSLST